MNLPSTTVIDTTIQQSPQQVMEMVSNVARATKALVGSRTKVMQDRYDITAYCATQGPRGATDDDLARALPQINANALRARRGDCINYGTTSDPAGEVRRIRLTKRGWAHKGQRFSVGRARKFYDYNF